MSKIAVFTDIHFGEHQDSKAHNEMCIEFIEWFITQAKDQGADKIIFMGDWHHNQSRIGSETLNYSYKGCQLLNDSGLDTFFIIGNHDILYKDTRQIHSLPFLSDFPNIIEVNDAQSYDDVSGKKWLMVPWVTPNDDLSEHLQTNYDYVFGHFEFPGFMMNEMYKMPDRVGKMKADVFTKPKFVFSGHFHKRQSYKVKGGATVWYVGNAFPHNMSDAGDRDRGMMILDQSIDDVSFINWPDMPTYDKVKLSELLENPDNYGSRATVKVIQDIVLNETERDEMRTALTETVGIGRVSIDPAQPEEFKELEIDHTEKETLNEKVEQFLSEQDWNSIIEGSSSERMITLYSRG